MAWVRANINTNCAKLIGRFSSYNTLMTFVLPIAVSRRGKESYDTSPRDDSKNIKTITDTPIDHGKDLEEISKVNDNIQTPELDYVIPQWGKPLNRKLNFEVMKNGQIIETIELPQGLDYLVCGRIPTCDLPMEHSSISRFHAILQFDSDGKMFIFDLDSSNGSFVNKKRSPARTFMPVSNGDLLKFGESSRFYILNDDDDDGQFNEGEGHLLNSRSEDKKDKEEKKFAFENPVKLLREWLSEYSNTPLIFEKISNDHDENHNTGVTHEDDGIALRVKINGEMNSSGEDLIFTGRAKIRKEAERIVCEKACIKLKELGDLVYEHYKEGDIDGWEDLKRFKQEEIEAEEDSFYDQTSLVKRSKVEEVHSLQSLKQKRLFLLNRIDEIKKNNPPTAADQEDIADENSDELDKYMSLITKQSIQELTNVNDQELLLLEEELKGIERVLSKMGPLEIIIPKQPLPSDSSVSVMRGSDHPESYTNDNAAGDRVNDFDDSVEVCVSDGDDNFDSNTNDLKIKYGY